MSIFLKKEEQWRIYIWLDILLERLDLSIKNRLDSFKNLCMYGNGWLETKLKFSTFS